MSLLCLTGKSLFEGEKIMVAERMHKCWEIMQCDENSGCPVRLQNIARCWEWMAQSNEFQCQYGLCSECIVYLCNSGITFLSEEEIHQVMKTRGLESGLNLDTYMQH